jgi:hypothetical protein
MAWRSANERTPRAQPAEEERADPKARGLPRGDEHEAADDRRGRRPADEVEAARAGGGVVQIAQQRVRPDVADAQQRERREEQAHQEAERDALQRGARPQGVSHLRRQALR